MELLRNDIAGDYLAVAQKVHASALHQACFDHALKLIANRLVRFFQQFDQVAHVSPEVGTQGYLNDLAAVRRHDEEALILGIRQFEFIELQAVIDATNRQAAVVGVGKAKVQAKLLFQQLGLDDLDIEQLHIRILI